MIIPESLLMRHVVESNKIEGESSSPTDPLVRSHLLAAIAVARKAQSSEFVHPREIHFLLCQGTDMEKIGGRLRSEEVYVGSSQMPAPEHVGTLMDCWDVLAQEYLCDRGMDGKEASVRADTLAIYLLCIHPFEDGNGRTARLMHNMLRLRHGLHWLVVKDRRRFRYFERIREVEADFKNKFPDVYSSPASA